MCLKVAKNDQNCKELWVKRAIVAKSVRVRLLFSTCTIEVRLLFEGDYQKRADIIRGNTVIYLQRKPYIWHRSRKLILIFGVRYFLHFLHPWFSWCTVDSKVYALNIKWKKMFVNYWSKIEWNDLTPKSLLLIHFLVSSKLDSFLFTPIS